MPRRLWLRRMLPSLMEAVVKITTVEASAVKVAGVASVVLLQ